MSTDPVVIVGPLVRVGGGKTGSAIRRGVTGCAVCFDSRPAPVSANEDDVLLRLDRPLLWIDFDLLCQAAITRVLVDQEAFGLG
jgi:hypothetical protein